MAGPGDFPSVDPSKGAADDVVPAAPLLPGVVPDAYPMARLLNAGRSTNSKGMMSLSQMT